MPKRRRLERPLTIAEVASMFDPAHSYEQTRRMLKAKHKETNGKLLSRAPAGFGAGVRWVVTRAALRRAWPDLFEDTRDRSDELDELLEESRRLRRQQEMTATAVGGLTREIARLKRGLAEA